MSLLIKSIEYVKFLISRNINIQKVITTAVSDKGIKLCRKLGFKTVREYDTLSSSIRPILFEIDFRDESLSRYINSIKEVILENDEYLGI